MATADPVSQLWEIVTKGSESALAKLGDSAERTAKAVEEGAKQSKKAGKEFESLKKQALGVVAGFVGFQAIKGAISGTIGGAIKLESALAGVKKTLPSGADFAGISAGIKEMSTKIPIATVALAKIAETAGQLGVKATEILGFTRVMGDLAATTNILGEEGATDLARFAGIIDNKLGPAYDRIASTLVDLGNNSKATEKQILEFGTRLAAAGKFAGLSESSILGFSAAIASTGIEAEAGGTAFSLFLKNVKNATIEGGEALKGFASVAGLSVEAFASKMKTDASGAIQDFIAGLGRINQGGGSASATLESLGFSGERVQDVFLRLSTAGTLVADSLKIATKAWGENTALAKEAAQRYETAASQIEIAKNKIALFAADIGAKLAPAFVAAIKFAADYTAELTVLAGVAASVFAAIKITAWAGAIKAGFAAATAAVGTFVAGAIAKLAAFDAAILATTASTGLMIAAFAAVAVGLVAIGVAVAKFREEFPDASWWQTITVAVTGNADAVLKNLDAQTKLAEVSNLGSRALEQQAAIAASMGVSVDDLRAKYGPLLADWLSAAPLNDDLKRAIDGVTTAQRAQTVTSANLSALQQQMNADWAAKLEADRKDAEAMAKSAQAANKYAGELRSLLDSVGAFSSADIANQARLFTDAFKVVPEGSRAFAELAAQVAEYATQLRNAGKAVPEALRVKEVEHFKLVIAGAVERFRQAPPALAEIKTGIESLIPPVGMVNGKLEDTGEIVVQDTVHVSDLTLAAQRFAIGIGDAFSDAIASGKSFGQALGGVAQSLVGALQGKVAGAVSGALGGALTKGLGKSLGGLLGGPLGSIAGSLAGSVVGKVGGFLGGLFGGKKKKEAKENIEEVKQKYEELLARVKEGTDQAVGGLGKLFSAFRVDGAESLSRLGAISDNVFKAMTALPGGARKAIESLGPGLDAIVKKAKDAGLALPDGIAGLLGKRDFIAANKDLFDSMEGLTEIAQGLAKANSFTAEGFAAIQQQASATIAQMVTAGGAIPDILAEAAPVLQAIVNENLQNKTAIDAATQGYIDQAAQLGLVKLAGNDAFAAATAQTNRLLAGMGVIFGKEGAISKFINDTSAVGVTSAANVSTAWTGAATSASASWSSTAQSVLASTTTIANSAQSTAAGVSASVTAIAAQTTASVASVVDSTGAKFGSLAGRIKAALLAARDLGTDRLPEFHAGGFTGGGSGEFMAKLKRREFVLDEGTTSRFGGERALSAAQRGDDSLLRAALGAVSDSGAKSVPVRGSGGATTAPATPSGPIGVNVFIGGRQLTPDVIEIVGRGNQERTIAVPQPQEIV